MQIIGPRFSTLGTEYTQDQVLALLTNPCGVEDTLFERVDGQTLQSKGDISSYVGRSKSPVSLGNAVSATEPMITHDTSQAVPRTLALTIRADVNLDWFNDAVRVWRRVLAPDGGWIEFQQGIFVPVAPSEQLQDSGIWRNATFADWCQLLNDDTYQVAVSSLSGASYMAEIISVLKSSIPVVRWIGTPSLAVLTADMSWNAGTSKLQRINDLLAAIGYQSIWFDEQGFARLDVLPDFSTRGDDYFFDLTSPSSITQSVIQEQIDTSTVVNAAIFTVENSQSTNSFSAYYENDSPYSPVSVLNFRRKISQLTDSSVADYTTALTRAKLAVQEGSRAYETVTWTTLLWPFSQQLEVYKLAWNDADEGLTVQRFVETAWSMSLEPGGLTSHTLQPLVSGV